MSSQSKPCCYLVQCISMGMLIVAVLSPSLRASEILKFSQRPMLETPLIDDVGFPKNYHGHDELSTAWFSQGHGEPSTYSGQLMADDFADKFTSPVVSVRWWGSYLNGPLDGVDKFLISFSTDVPADPTTNPFSHPGNEILSQVVTRGPLARGSGTFTEQLAYPLSVDGPIYEYNAELNLGQEFQQQPDTVYWLTIAALTENPDLRWGWHNRDYTLRDPLASAAPDVAPGERFIPLDQGRAGAWHFQDDAVSGSLVVEVKDGVLRHASGRGYVPEGYLSPSDGPVRIVGRGDGLSMDLAFELYTVPEPASFALAALGACILLVLRRRRTYAGPSLPSTLLSCLAACLIGWATSARAQTWTEFGDAGDLVGTHQDTVGAGPLTTISGSLSGAPFDLADIYCIRITDRTTFTATVAGAFDDEIPLWLFDSNGNGITSQEGFYLSTPTMITGALVPSSPGIYFLAISPHDTLPYSATGDIWSGSPRSTETGPNGTGAPGPLAYWSSFGSAIGGPYSINLTGAEYGNCIPEPDAFALAMIGVVGSFIAHRRASRCQGCRF